jgi:capsular polysaccharide biosynthesis protein
VEALYFSPSTSRSGHDLPEADRWLRERILPGRPPAPPTRRLYISRRLATHWKIVNEEEVEACLRRYGFETHSPEQLSVREQAALFAQAEAVVSNHGAGLTNILFAPAGARVLDIQDPTNVCYCYWTMSEALGHQYWYLWGQPIPRPENRHGIPDLCVPVERLAATLERMLPA